MTANPKVAIDIAANDKTAKGIDAANRRFKKLGSDVDKVGGRGGGMRGVARTFGEVEEAAAKAFGSKSAFGGVGARIGAVRQLGSAIGTSFGRASVGLGEAAVAAGAAEAGLGEAATAAGGLAVAMGPVAIVGATVVATLGAATVAGYKFSAGWAASTAQMGRFAETIGIASRDLQQLQGAAERFGIGKDATNSAVSSFATTVHDARYGRNNEALALMMRLGVRFRNKADGTLDYASMLGDTSDALARQKDPQTALMIANRLGIAGMLPLLRKGSGTLRTEEASVGKYGAVNSDGDIANAQRFTRSAVILGQMADRKKQGAQAWTAGKYAPAIEGAVGLGQRALDGTLGSGAAAFGRSVIADFAPAAAKIASAGDKFLRAAEHGASEIGHGLIGAAQAAARNWGLPASITLGQAMLESGFGRHMAAGSNNLFGVKARPGDPFVTARTREEDRFGRSHYVNARFRKYDSLEDSVDDHARLLMTSGRYAGARKLLPDVDRFADGLTGVYATDHRYGRKLRSTIDGNGYKQYDEMPVKVEISMRDVPKGTHATVTAGRSAPAVSHALAH